MIVFQEKSFKPVETLILLLIFIYHDSIISKIAENLLGEANIIYAAYIFIKFLVGFYIKRYYFDFLQPVF